MAEWWSGVSVDSTISMLIVSDREELTRINELGRLVYCSGDGQFYHLAQLPGSDLSNWRGIDFSSQNINSGIYPLQPDPPLCTHAVDLATLDPTTSVLMVSSRSEMLELGITEIGKIVYCCDDRSYYALWQLPSSELSNWMDNPCWMRSPLPSWVLGIGQISQPWVPRIGQISQPAIQATDEESATPVNSVNPICADCIHYHGQRYGGNLLVCAMHPYGPEEGYCSDYENLNSDSESSLDLEDCETALPISRRSLALYAFIWPFVMLFGLAALVLVFWWLSRLGWIGGVAIAVLLQWMWKNGFISI